MRRYENEAGDTCDLCYKMAHHVTDPGDILCSEHARKHREWTTHSDRSVEDDKAVEPENWRE